MGSVCPRRPDDNSESLLDSRRGVGVPPASWVNNLPGTPQEAVDGLEASYKKLASVSLPPGGAAVLTDLRKNIRQLQGLVKGAKAPVALPWARPLPDEQEGFEAKCPEGGVLLRSQVCVAAEGNPAEEWVMGVLFVSDRGVLFEGGGGLLPDLLNSGFVRWPDVMAIEHRGLADGHPSTGPSSAPREVILTHRKDGNVTCLQLQLSIAKDSDWIEEAWRVCRDGGQMRQGTLGDTELDGSFQFHSVSDGSPQMSSGVSGGNAFGDAPVPSMTASLTRDVNYLPDDGAAGSIMVLDELWPEVALEQVRVGLDADDWTLSRMIREKSNPENFVSDPPVQSRTTPGLVVRRTRFLLTLPKEVPRAVAALVGAPEKSNVTQIIAYRAADDELSVVMQAITHDVPFGQDFRVQEMYKWTTRPEGGVQFQCWSQAVWTRKMPWTHGALMSYLSKKAASEGTECAKILSRLCQAKDEV